MEPKTLVFGLIAVVIGGGGLLVMNGFTVESLKADIRSKEADVEAVQESVKRSKEELERANKRMEDARQAAVDLQTKQDEVLTLERAVATKSKNLEQAKDLWKETVKEMEKSIEQARLSFRNQIVPEISLKTGAIKDCRLASYQDGSVSVQHTTGVSKLTHDQLPPELAARVRLNFKPVLNLPVDPDAPAPAPSVTASATPTESATPPSAPTAESEMPAIPEVKDPTRSNDYQTRQHAISQLTAYISGAEVQKRTFLQQAREADAKYRDARFYGRSTSQGAIRDKAQASADAIQVQIDQAQAKIIQLRSEMNAIQQR